MKEIIDIKQAKTIMKNLNVIIYGTIRDIENYFFNSFSNIDILTSYFNKSFIIIFENDSKDNTRKLLEEWYNHVGPNTKKKIILMNHLENNFPLRAHRLAYARNVILEYIFKNNLNNDYQYAIHIDLDDRFWSVDFNSICNSFQYNLNEWDMMSCVSKNNTYYDWWALRHPNSWFNKNIFSCDANGKNIVISDNSEDYEYEKRSQEFYDIIKSSSLIRVNSAFNGFAIYKLSSMKNCYYSADYKCSKCNGKNRGCWEDNDHIGLHKQMVRNGARLFINTKMNITNMPKNTACYNHYIIKNKDQITNLGKNPLTYLLSKKFADDKDGTWLEIGIENEEIPNQISKYIKKTLYVLTFPFLDHSSFLPLSGIETDLLVSESSTRKGIKNGKNCNYEILFLNKNIQLIEEDGESIINFKNTVLNNTSLSFIYIHPISYQSIKEIFHSLIDKIRHDCVIVFQEFINHREYFLHEYKAFYEIMGEYNVKFKFIGMNGIMDINLAKNENLTDPNNKIVAISIVENPFFMKKQQPFGERNIPVLSNDFDWIYYIHKYDDLKHVESKEEAWEHWIQNGSKEGRVYKNMPNDNPVVDFDWIYYIHHYDDLKHISTKEEAWEHYIHHGIKEGRIYKEKLKDTIEMDTIETDKEPDYEIDEDFDWVYYKDKYIDLNQIQTKKEAWYHWIHFGKKEGRSYDSFDWYLYLKLNPDLVDDGLCTKEEVIHHWKTYGKKEGRQHRYPFFSERE